MNDYPIKISFPKKYFKEYLTMSSDDICYRTHADGEKEFYRIIEVSRHHYTVVPLDLDSYLKTPSEGSIH